MSYTIKRSKRRTLAIKISAGEVLVHAPMRMPESTIAAFVSAKQTWITDHVERQRQLLQALPQRQWCSGERLRWLGEPLTLQIFAAPRNQVSYQQQQLQLGISSRSRAQTKVPQLVQQWYQQQAQQWLDVFFANWPANHALQPKCWSVGSFRSKWGHCTRAGELRFSWKLWLAPEWVVTDVVLHELCHLQQFNHSAQFWQLVKRYAPNHDRSDQWLRQHGLTVLNDAYLDYIEPTD
jgi:predicted metal-dependent hydrolase